MSEPDGPEGPSPAARSETEQERFWKGDFGDAYSRRNVSDDLLTSNQALFARILRSAPGVRSIVELGCNIGLNLRALNALDPGFKLCGYEINEGAAEQARSMQIAEIRRQSILEPSLAGGGTFDLAFTKGVLIHIDPESLHRAYANLWALSSKYILVVEYYNPTPVEIIYRGEASKLFKRDFAGELMDKFDIELVDYGFAYHRDNYFPQDDCTWFLLKRR